MQLEVTEGTLLGLCPVFPNSNILHKYSTCHNQEIDIDTIHQPILISLVLNVSVCVCYLSHVQIHVTLTIVRYQAVPSQLPLLFKFRFARVNVKSNHILIIVLNSDTIKENRVIGPVSN